MLQTVGIEFSNRTRYDFVLLNGEIRAAQYLFTDPETQGDRDNIVMTDELNKLVARKDFDTIYQAYQNETKERKFSTGEQP